MTAMDGLRGLWSPHDHETLDAFRNRDSDRRDFARAIAARVLGNQIAQRAAGAVRPQDLGR